MEGRQSELEEKRDKDRLAAEQLAVALEQSVISPVAVKPETMFSEKDTKEPDKPTEDSFKKIATSLYKKISDKKPDDYKGKAPEFKDGEMILQFESKQDEKEYFLKLAESGQNFSANDVGKSKKFSGENGVLYQYGTFSGKTVVPGQNTNALTKEVNDIGRERETIRNAINEATSKGEPVDAVLVKKEQQLFEKLEKKDLQREERDCRLKGRSPQEMASRLEQLKGFYREDAALRTAHQSLSADREAHNKAQTALANEEINLPREPEEADRVKLQEARASLEKDGSALDKRAAELSGRYDTLAEGQKAFYEGKSATAVVKDQKATVAREPQMKAQSDTNRGSAGNLNNKAHDEAVKGSYDEVRSGPSAAPREVVEAGHSATPQHNR